KAPRLPVRSRPEPPGLVCGDAGAAVGHAGERVMAISIKRASVFCEGLDHPECVAVHPDGTLYAGGEAGQIYHISADGKRVDHIASTGGFVLGVAVSPDGTWLAVCDLRKQALLRLDLATGRLSKIAGGFSI